MPRYSDMAPYYDEMLAGFERTSPDFDINVGNLPYCVLPQWAVRIHHGGQETVTKSSDGEGLEDEMNKYAWQASLRAHLPSCSECVLRSRCTGIFRAYLDMYGGAEFQPLTAARLREIDPDRRNFVLLVEPQLAALRAALATGGLPPGWQATHIGSEERRRRIGIGLRHGSGESLELRFVPPETANAAVLESLDYAVEAEAGLGLPLPALAELLAWLRTQLSGGAEVELARDAVERALAPARLAKGRRRVLALTRRLHGGLSVPGWQLAGLHWPAADRAELRISGPGAAAIVVVFGVSLRHGRSQVSIDFRVDEGPPLERIRAVIDPIVRMLRAGKGEDAPLDSNGVSG